MDLLAVEQAAYALQQHCTIYYTPHMCVIVCDVFKCIYLCCMFPSGLHQTVPQKDRHVQ